MNELHPDAVSECGWHRSSTTFVIAQLSQEIGRSLIVDANQCFDVSKNVQIPILSVPREMKNFAKGVQKDAKAIAAAIMLPWSNGQTEGHVNRLKTIKRQMYGRASFELLRARFLKIA